MTQNIIENITVTLVERKWMRAAHAFRFSFSLPQDIVLSAVLTAMIDTQVNAHITTAGGIVMKIDPAIIVDVPHKGKNFQVVIETVYENQNGIGPRLTEVASQTVTLSFFPADQVSLGKEKEKRSGTITDEALKGLHSQFFKNPKFHAFFSDMTGAHIKNEQECKEVFKGHMGVDSCSEINQEDFKRVLDSFSAWVNGAGRN